MLTTMRHFFRLRTTPRWYLTWSLPEYEYMLSMMVFSSSASMVMRMIFRIIPSTAWRTSLLRPVWSPVQTVLGIIPMPTLSSRERASAPHTPVRMSLSDWLTAVLTSTTSTCVMPTAIPVSRRCICRWTIRAFRLLSVALRCQAAAMRMPNPSLASLPTMPKPPTAHKRQVLLQAHTAITDGMAWRLTPTLLLVACPKTTLPTCVWLTVSAILSTMPVALASRVWLISAWVATQVPMTAPRSSTACVSRWAAPVVSSWFRQAMTVTAACASTVTLQARAMWQRLCLAVMAMAMPIPAL